jgi:hypothetical protein
MVSVHKLCVLINESSLIDDSEHQDGSIRILYQSRTCNIMQGSGHIHSQCKYDDEYQYRYTYDVGVSRMDFYLRGMDMYIMYRLIPDMVGYSHSQYVALMVYVSRGS